MTISSHEPPPPYNQERLEHLERLATVGTLSASITHEVKNALVAVKTFVNLLLERDPGAELAQLAAKELNRMERLVCQALRLAAPAKGAFAEIDLHETLSDALSLVNSQAAERAISLRSELRAARFRVRGDSSQLEQAFLNVLLNAFEAIGHAGTVLIKTENSRGADSDPELICVTIQDSGPGIPAENSNRIFDEFFTTKTGGTGLGLPITRRIVQGHAGSLECSSLLGRGTAFHIRIPLLKT